MSVLPSLASDARTPISLALILVAALSLRLFLLAGPQTQLESDEAIIGLMARHILEGERPVFYWGQHYMGALEAYLAAAPVALLGSTGFALKLAPLVVGLAFVGLVFATGYRLGGLPAAVVSGLYVALAPAFLALWSLKARGGYIEVLALGQILILLSLEAAKRRSMGSGRGALMGVLAGVGLWTNTLIGVYLLPIAVYLAFSMRRRLVGWWIVAAAIGVLIGAAPLISYNLSTDFATMGAMFNADEPLRDPADAFGRMLQYSLPVLVGLAQGSSSWAQFGEAYFAGPAARRLVEPVLVLLFAVLILLQLRGLARLVQGRDGGDDGRNLLALILIAAPVLFVFSKFREQVIEPRYLLPLYSAAPVLAAYWVTRRYWRRFAAPLFIAGFLALNAYSIAALDPRLNLPATAVSSSPANRAELTKFLLDMGRDHIYTDYWLAYSLAFESGERIRPSVVSGGYNRYIPYAHAVSVVPNPAWVFISGSKEEQELLKKWSERGVQANKEIVAVYSVYWDAEPLDKARP